jgi:hypothetical protein
MLPDFHNGSLFSPSRALSIPRRKKQRASHRSRSPVNDEHLLRVSPLELLVVSPAAQSKAHYSSTARGRARALISQDKGQALPAIVAI